MSVPLVGTTTTPAVLDLFYLTFKEKKVLKSSFLGWKFFNKKPDMKERYDPFGNVMEYSFSKESLAF